MDGVHRHGHGVHIHDRNGDHDIHGIHGIRNHGGRIRMKDQLSVCEDGGNNHMMDDGMSIHMNKKDSDACS